MLKVLMSMIKKTTIFLFLFININALFSQIIKVEYYTFTKNTIDTTGIKSYLLFDKDKSLFVWKSIYQEVTNTKEANNEGVTKINVKKIFRDTIGRRVFNKYSDKKLILREPFLEKNFKLLDSKLDIDWKITDEIKYFDKIKCRKAKGHFRGRNYIVWYTLEFPVPTGPWKLNGLPGLIIEAYDEKREVNFLFKKLYNCKKCIKKIGIDNNVEIISIKNFIEQRDELYLKEINKNLSKLPRGTKIIKSSFKKRKGIELIYEWESETKEN